MVNITVYDTENQYASDVVNVMVNPVENTITDPPGEESTSLVDQFNLIIDDAMENPFAMMGAGSVLTLIIVGIISKIRSPKPKKKK